MSDVEAKKDSFRCLALRSSSELLPSQSCDGERGIRGGHALELRRGANTVPQSHQKNHFGFRHSSIASRRTDMQPWLTMSSQNSHCSMARSKLSASFCGGRATTHSMTSPAMAAGTAPNRSY